MVEMFSGVSSASHYLGDLFYPVAAFDKDPEARAVISNHFPRCVMATNFESVMSAGSSPGTFLASARDA